LTSKQDGVYRHGFSQNTSTVRRCLSVGVLTFILLVLTGCAGMQAFREGNSLLDEGQLQAGLAKLDEAARLEPKNAEYRIAARNQRATIVNRLMATAEGYRAGGRLADAEAVYRQVQEFDAQNAMARQGLDLVASERRHQAQAAEIGKLAASGKAGDRSQALEKLRPILQENPKHKEALRLKSQIDEANFKDSGAQAQLAAAYRKPITLEFRDAPLKSVFEVIAKVSGLNFFFDKELRSDLKVSILARNTAIKDAVRLLLVTNQLEQKVLNERSILIYPNTPQKLRDYQTLAVRTFYLTNADVKAVSNTIKTIVKTKDLVIDERLGLIIMRDTPEAIRMAERLVELQDLSDPEVMLEVEIAEVKRTRLLELGIRWPDQMTLAPLQLSTGVPLTLQDLGNLNRSNIQATVGGVTLNARKEDTDGSILANPRIRVRNKEKAKVMIGDKVPVITTTSNATGFVSESVSYLDVGLRLEVEPTIYLDDEVGIKVSLEVSNLVREILSKSGTLSYQIGSRGANTVLRLKDGETQILAGLINDEDRSTAYKVPALGEIPVLGRLFGSHKDDTQRSEILLSITPRVVRSIRRPDLLSAEFDSGTEASIGAASLLLGSTDSAAVAPGSPTRRPGDRKADSKPANSAETNTAMGPGQAATEQPASVAQGEAPLTPALGLSWQVPAQARVGERFTTVLRVAGAAKLQSLPLVMGFDPRFVEVAEIREGDFFRQGGATSQFTHRIDTVEGKVFVTAQRSADPAGGSSAPTSGSVMTATFKVVRANPQAPLRILSAMPEPASANPLAVPMEQLIRLVP
jgi:general secretion pathway protein D